MLPTTWFYVSSLIILAAFFKFNRFFSIRNLDLIGLILFTPGLLMIAMHDGCDGYNWLFLVGFLMGIRLLFDTVMVRRPLLEPNLTPGGLTFACFTIFGFLAASIAFNRADHVETLRTVRLEQILTVRDTPPDDFLVHADPFPSFDARRFEPSHHVKPGFVPFLRLTALTSRALVPSQRVRQEILMGTLPVSDTFDSSPLSPVPSPAVSSRRPDQPGGDRTGEIGFSLSSPVPLTDPANSVEESPVSLPDSQPDSPANPSADFSDTKTTTGAASEPEPVADTTFKSERKPPVLTVIGVIVLALVADLMIVLAFLHIGHCHFGNIRTGIACAMLYMLLPYTNQIIGSLDHTVPAALILWAVAMYRRPFFSGAWIGLAGGLAFYPLFLIPLWLSFYWRRGWVRFVIGSGTMILLLIALLPAFPEGRSHFGTCLLQMFGDGAVRLAQPDGFWEFANPIYRIPVLAAFFVTCFGMILWPSHKHLGTLLCCSALLMLSVSFWQSYQGGIFMAWYLPTMILTIFRPNLEDRTAQAVVVE
ncbi:MAG TPA: hypothetical protein DEB39_09525 [Planctomycetaceae bacterium]|nr:hypothetical protein [Planctomycetaceae bacterium]